MARGTGDWSQMRSGAKGDLVSNDGTNNAVLPVGTDGYALVADSTQTLGIKWQLLTGTGTVTSVAMTVPSWLSVSGSPIASSGTLAITANSQSANLFLASPNGSSGAPTPRAIVSADLPTLGAEITSSSGTSCTNGADTIVALATTVRDDGGFVSGSHTNALTVPTGAAGWYIITASVRWATNSSGSRYLWIKKNGSFTTGPIGASSPSTIGDVAMQASYVTYLAVGDYIQIDAFQNSGGTVSVNGATLSMMRQ